MDIDALGLAGGLPLPAAVGEAPDQFLLLGIHRDDRLPSREMLLGLLVQVPKLGVPIWVLGAL
jgi:hypothetical protein